MIKTRGIIFRTVKYSETSIIADIFTETAGLRTYIVSGVRQTRAKIPAGLMQVMSLVDIVAYDKAEKLNRIKEIRAAHVYTRLPFEIERSSIGIFMAEIARRSLRETEKNEALFQFLFEIFRFLDETQKPFFNLHLLFMLDLSGFLGFKPFDDGEESPHLVFDLKEGVFTADTVGHTHFLSERLTQILRGVLASSYDTIENVKMTRDERRQLLDQLVQFYRWHIEGFPEINTLKILQEIF